MTTLRDRILATRAEAERRLALAEAATPGPWLLRSRVDRSRSWVAENGGMTVCVPSVRTNAAHIAANDPTTVAAEQRRILAACDADLALLDWTEWREAGGPPPRVVSEPALRTLIDRYPEVEA